MRRPAAVVPAMEAPGSRGDAMPGAPVTDRSRRRSRVAFRSVRLLSRVGPVLPAVISAIALTDSVVSVENLHQMSIPHVSQVLYFHLLQGFREEQSFHVHRNDKG